MLVWLLAVVALARAAAGAQAYFALADDHPAERWRQAAGRPPATLQRTLVWVRHDNFGIGNTLHGFASAMLDAFVEDRSMVINSVVVQKFCEVLACSIRQLQRPDGERYVLGFAAA